MAWIALLVSHCIIETTFVMFDDKNQGIHLGALAAV